MSDKSESEVPHDLEVGQVLIKFDSSRWKVTKRMVDVDHEEVIYRLEESDVGPSMAFSELMTQDAVLNLYRTADGEPVTDGGVDQSEAATDRCGVCRDRVVGVVDALQHYLDNHPKSDLLHNTLSDVEVRTECSGCGDTFTASVSVGIDAKEDKAMPTVASYCDDCIDSDPFNGMMVKEMAAAEVVDREVTDDV